MAKILIYDTEANSLDTERGFIQELAYGIFDTDSKRCLSAKSCLLKWQMGYTVDPGAFAVTKLSRELCEANGEAAGLVFEQFLDLIIEKRVDYLAGHNILGYDNKILKSNIKRSYFDNPEILDSIPHIDTYIDVPYPETMKNYTLKYLALDHGYVLTGAHEALNDVFACAHILLSYPFDLVSKNAESPLVTFSAYTAYADTESREQLAGLKFRWSREMKRWEKRGRKCSIDTIRKVYFGKIFIDDVLYSPPSESSETQLDLPF